MIKTIFSSEIANFLNLVRYNIRYKCGINIIWPRWTSPPNCVSSYIFCFTNLSGIDFNMVATNTAAKKVMKDSPYKWTPKTPWYFINFWYFSYTYFSNWLTIWAKFHEIAKYIILYRKIELLQRFGTLDEKKNSSLKTSWSKQSFPTILAKIYKTDFSVSVK